MFTHDKNNNFKSSAFVDTKTMPELYELVEKYQVEVLWSDGIWFGDSNYWKSKTFLHWLITNSSVKDTVVWNDRWGNDTKCKHGSFWNCEDRYLPNTTSSHYFENCFTLDKHSWGANRKSSAKDYLTTKELLDMVVKTVSRNGNVLVNVGPSADGTIHPLMVDRLLEMGKWLKVNGPAVYSTRSWIECPQEEERGVYYTRSVGRQGGDVLYAFLTKWPTGNKVELSCPTMTNSTKARMLGLKDGEFELGVSPTYLSNGNSAIDIALPLLTPDIIPCQHIWVLEIEGVGNLGPAETSEISPDESNKVTVGTPTTHLRLS